MGTPPSSKFVHCPAIEAPRKQFSRQAILNNLVLISIVRSAFRHQKNPDRMWEEDRRPEANLPSGHIFSCAMHIDGLNSSPVTQATKNTRGRHCGRWPTGQVTVALCQIW